MKYRISFFIEDYYSYLGKDPDMIAESKRNKVLGTIPYGFQEKLYNLKFKEIKYFYGTFYRVHFSVNMEESEIKEIFDERKDWCHSPENISYKPIKTHDKRRSNFNSR